MRYSISNYMKLKHIIPVLLILVLTGCSANPSANPVPPIQKPATLVALDTILVACATAATLTAPGITVWLNQCPTVVIAVSNALSANSPATVIQASVVGVQNFLATAPTGLPVQDQKLVAAILVATQSFLTIYQQQFPSK